MARVTVPSAAICALAVFSLTATAAEAAAPLPVWPHPMLYTGSDQHALVLPSFTVSTTAGEPANGLILSAGARLAQRSFVRTPLQDTQDDVEVVTAKGDTMVLQGVVVNVQEPDTDLQLGVDESYTLDIPVSGAATLNASTVYGAYHGLETLSQLIIFDVSSEVYKVENLPLHIEDAPRFPHRGLLIDSGRHFEPVSEVKAIIDSMTMAKINTLHWHLTEIQSFPAPSRIHPELAEMGAFSSQERYSWGELQDVVSYARARGVRVVPEFDMPGHTASWNKSHPELFPEQPCGKDIAFDPAKPEVSSFIKEVIADWAEVFTDKVFHIGTDEVPQDCWNNLVDQDFMHEKGLVSLDQLFGYFVGEMAGIVKGLGKQPAMWDESIIRASAPSGAIVQIWHGNDNNLLQRALEAGNDAVFSPDVFTSGASGWYLDHLKVSWQQMYDVEPTSLAGDMSSVSGRLLGGEGCMWGETVDPSDMESTVWPRLAAIAERLWSPLDFTSAGAAAAEERFAIFRCLLLQRGVRAGLVGLDGRASPTGPSGCGDPANLRCGFCTFSWRWSKARGDSGSFNPRRIRLPP